MRAYGRSGRPDEALRLLRRMPHRRRRWAVLSYNTALNAVVDNGGGPLEVAAVLDEMHSTGISMDASTHNILLKLPSCSRSFARRVFDEMSTRGFPADETSFSTVITRLSRSGKIEEACNILNEMIKSGRRPNPFCYTPILQAFCSRGRTEEARALMTMMEENGCAASTVANNILLSGLCRRRDFHAAEKLLAESSTTGWRPSVVSFNTFMHGLCNAGRVAEAFSQLAAMAAHKLCPSAVTVNILLCGVCRCSGSAEGKRLLDASSKMGWEVSAVNFNTIMSAFCATGNWAAAPPMLTQMLKRAVKPDSRTFNIVLNSLCKTRNLQKAKRVMESGGFKPNTVSYNTLIAGFSAAGEAAEAEELLRRMAEEGVEQDVATYTMRIEWLCREKRIEEAKQVFKDLKRHFSPDLVVYGVLIGGLVREGDMAAGRRLLREMMNQGLTPVGPTFDLVIRAFCRSGLCRTGEINGVVGEMFG